ncbi:MAG: Maf family protein [Acutalibacteraceae bacterium]
MLYLASASPRRRDLLKLAGFRFTVEPAEIDEVIAQDDPACLVQNLALKKARAVAKLHPDDVVLAADTVVALDNHILGKPQDEEQAQKMLRMLSNRVHQVYTGYCILKQSRCEIGVLLLLSFILYLTRILKAILQQANPLTKPADTVSKA